jgi:hypothetical protein
MAHGKLAVRPDFRYRALHVLMLPMVPVGENEFVVWDLVERRGARLRYEGAGASVHLLDVSAIDLAPKAH